ncbi:MAG TPA: S46 family peptidase [Flavitalea sp.]|nr:S46 family peptidase [Flavitalea sp.]
MKKLLVSLVLIVSMFRSYADEGMWLPLLLGKQVYDDMVKRGLKLSKEQLYSINKASVKDAVVLFSGFCTGEIVSNEGLIFTNHHCGYGAIAGASSVQQNLLKNGFWAKTKAEEIPADGLYIEFLLQIHDLTQRVEDSLRGLSGSERAARQRELIATLNAEFSDSSKNISARVSPLFKGNQFMAFVYQRYNDIRLAGAPPESVGKYGGDTDNWEWPRHTGDFSVFRAYMGKDGQPAGYSPDNIPLKPKYFLPVSIKGVKTNDYAMIYGYPGSTNRYETSYGVKQKIDIFNPSLVALREIRLKYIFEEMKKDPAVKLKLASSAASIANYWKFYDGERKQLIRHDVYRKKLQEEEKFKKWATGKPEFEHVFTDLSKAYDAWRPYSKHQVYINEGIFGSPLMAFAGTLQQVERAIVKSGGSKDIEAAAGAADKAWSAFIRSEHVVSDKQILAAVLQQFYTDIDQNQHPIGFYSSLKKDFGDLKDPATYKKFADHVFGSSFLLDSIRWRSFVRNPDANVLQNDPAFSAANAFLKNFQGKYLPLLQQFNTRNDEAGRLYLKGILQMDTVKARKLFPDATMTMRVSFGSVKGYEPKDAVTYDHATTMKGVLEKYKEGDYEFDLDPRVRELALKKDFGQYIDKQRQDLVVNFITNNDITGGNSGSPVIDANGNLIGLAFDGNYEALGHKIVFDNAYNRTICVDIRYVLWCIDKVGGAANLIRELKIVK